MKKWIKKAGVLFAAVAVMCSLISCSENDDVISIEESVEEEPEYLSFFSGRGLAGSDLGKYWVEKFAQKYERKVYINYDGASYYADEGLSYRELLEKRLQGSQPDDLYIINAEDVLEFEKKGFWMDLSDMSFVDNLSEAALYQSTYNGKVFSVPLEFTGFGFYWNVDMLQKYHLSVPENLDEFLNVCETLKAEGILPYGANKGYALTVPAMGKGMAGLYGEEGLDERIADLNSLDIPVSTYMREGFAFISMMIEKGYLDPQQALAMAPGEEYDMFRNGECGFVCAGLAEPTFVDADDFDFNLMMTGCPILEDGCIAVYGAGSRLCVNPDSRYLDTALEFIEMVGTKEALDESAILGKSMSTAKGSDVSVLPMQEKMCELLKMPGQIPNQDFALHFNTWENIRDICREICGGISVEEACEKMDEKQREEVAEYAGN